MEKKTCYRITSTVNGVKFWLTHSRLASDVSKLGWRITDQQLAQAIAYEENSDICWRGFDICWKVEGEL